MDDEPRQISAAQADEIRRCYEANAKWLTGYASALLGGDRRTHDARGAPEDLVQDTFEAATHAWETLRSLNEAQKRKWLRTTVLRTASRMGKRNQMLHDQLPVIYDPYPIGRTRTWLGVAALIILILSFTLSPVRANGL